MRHLSINHSGNKWTFDLYTGVRLTLDRPGGSVRPALLHIADCWFPDAVQDKRRKSIAVSRRITIACLLGSVAHTGILLWFFGNIPLVWKMSVAFPPFWIVILPPVVMRYVEFKYNWTVSYQRKRRRRTATPLPSPTTPEDSQT